MNEINNKPANFFYHFRNISVSRFNGLIGLNNLLDNFVGLQGNQENPLNFNIQSYMKQNLNQNYLFQEMNIKYLKINEHFFSYFSVNPVLSSKYDSLSFRIISFIFHSIVILEYVYSYIFLKREYSLFDNSENILYFVGFVYLFLHIICYVICLAMKSSYIRIDIIF
jgi:thiol-disulfide isomerase/thioredoxin